MQFAIHYTNSFRYYDEIDEVIFDYQDINKKNIVDFIPTIVKKETQKAIINISLVDNITEIIPYLVKLKSIHPNILIQIDLREQQEYIPILKDNKLDFMFSNYCNNYDVFYSMRKLGAKDIYIVESLAFDLLSLSDLTDIYGTRIRVFPDIAQSARGTRSLIPEETKFWIRPEDVELYEKYVDVFEICRTDSRQSVVYEIYKQQQWRGKINDLILDLNLNINNTNIDPHFGQHRINCRKKCMIGKCNLCSEICELAKKFNLAGIEIIKDKKERKMTEQEKEKLVETLKQIK